VCVCVCVVWPRLYVYADETEIRPRLTDEERERLAQHPHVFDYEFTPEQLVRPAVPLLAQLV
jgi:hypothetical protein